MPRVPLLALSLRRNRRANGPSAGYREREAHRHQAARSVVRRVLQRRWIDDGLDRSRLRLDTIPSGVYQPVPTLPLRHGTRARGSESRWAAMSPLIESIAPRNALDVGAGAAYFALQLGWRGIPTWLCGYLEGTCAGSRIEHLGHHAAFDADGNPCERNLSALIRIEDRRRPR